MRIYLRFLTAFLLICSVGILHAETLRDLHVTGIATADGEPMPGVSVLLKGTTTGTITDIDGKYSIQVPSNGTLVFSFVGMKTVEIAVNNKQVINVALESDSKELDEVMVVAYATAKKYSFTGAAATVKGEDIAKLQTSSISKALEGTVAGLQASATSGQPGTDADIRIRGIGSINGLSLCRIPLPRRWRMPEEFGIQYRYLDSGYLPALHLHHSLRPTSQHKKRQGLSQRRIFRPLC